MGSAISFLNNIESRKLRHNNLQDTTTLQIIETDTGMLSQHNLVEFIDNALLRDNFYTFGITAECFLRLVLNLET